MSAHYELKNLSPCMHKYSSDYPPLGPAKPTPRRVFVKNKLSLLKKARTLNVHGFMGPHSSEGTQRREDPTEPSSHFVEERGSPLRPGRRPGKKELLMPGIPTVYAKRPGGVHHKAHIGGDPLP